MHAVTWDTCLHVYPYESKKIKRGPKDNSLNAVAGGHFAVRKDNSLNAVAGQHFAVRVIHVYVYILANL